MAIAFGIRIAVNGSETDVDVENDSADWTEKIGNVRHTVGGGSWLRPSAPGSLQFDAMVPISDAYKVRTITVAVTCVPSPGVTMNTAYPPTVGTGAGAYRIIFHGDVQSARVTSLGVKNGDDRVQFDAVSEMSGLLNRQARCAASNNSGITDMLADIETAHGLTMGGNDHFPTVADGFPNSDRPAQKRVKNGQYIATMLAPTGVNMSEEWETSITAPALRWRPDFQDIGYHTALSVTNLWAANVGYPWLFSYDDVGIQYEDFVAKVTVNGEDSAGNQYYGWARLDTAALRAAAGNREASVTSYVDTAADCKTQARRLMAYSGDAGHLRMKQVTFRAEDYYAATVAGGYSSTSAATDVWPMVAGMPGDSWIARDNGVLGDWDNTNTDYGDWPSNAAFTDDYTTTLYSLWRPYVQGWGVSDITEYHRVRALTRTWDGNSGWTVTAGLEPDSQFILRGADVNADDTDSGTD